MNTKTILPALLVLCSNATPLNITVTTSPISNIIIESPKDIKETNNPKQIPFLENVLPILLEEYEKAVKLNPSLKNLNINMVAAQMILESRMGKSKLTKKSNNLFGIKGSYNGNYVLANDDKPNEKFKKYRNYRDSIKDYFIFIQKDRYQAVYQTKGDILSQATKLQKCGYATDKAYPQKLNTLYNLYLNDLQMVNGDNI